MRLLAFELAQVIRSLLRILSDPAAVDAAGPYASGGRGGVTVGEMMAGEQHGGAWLPDGVKRNVRGGCGGDGFGDGSGGGGDGGDGPGGGVSGGGGGLGGGRLTVSEVPVDGDAPARCGRQGARRTYCGIGGAAWWRAAHALLSRAHTVLQEALRYASNAGCTAADGSDSRRDSPQSGDAVHLSSGTASRRFWRHTLRRQTRAAGERSSGIDC